MNRQCSWHTVGAQHICGVNVCVHVHIRSSKEGDREQKGQSVCPKHFRNVIWSTPCLWATGPTRVLWDFFFFLISTSGRNRGLEARGDQLGEDLEFTLEGASWCQGFLSPGTAESLP